MQYKTITWISVISSLYIINSQTYKLQNINNVMKSNTVPLTTKMETSFLNLIFGCFVNSPKRLRRHSVVTLSKVNSLLQLYVSTCFYGLVKTDKRVFLLAYACMSWWDTIHQYLQGLSISWLLEATIGITGNEWKSEDPHDPVYLGWVSTVMQQMYGTGNTLHLQLRIENHMRKHSSYSFTFTVNRSLAQAVFWLFWKRNSLSPKATLFSLSKFVYLGSCLFF